MAATYFVVLLVVLGLGYGIAFTRKGKVTSAKLGGYCREVRTAAAPEQAFTAISALGRPFTVDDRDPKSMIVVLSSPVTLFSWGFIYPVFIHADGSGSRIEVGIHSKVFQIGPVVSHAHGKCVTAIEQALTLPAARVA